MSKIYYLFILLCSTSAFAQKNLRESVTLEKPPVIDGDVSDWSCDWWIDPHGKFFCNVTNDENNLYVRLKVGDDLTQQRIGTFGLSLKLNPSGKRKGKVGLKYPIGKDASELKKGALEQMDNSIDNRSKAQLKKEMLGDVEVVELIGLAKQNIVSSRLGLANGIEAIIVAQDDGSYLYEAKIPFRAFRIVKKDVKILGVEFETGKYNAKIVSSNQNASPSGGYGGGMPGGYGQGGARQPRYNMSNTSYQSNIFTTPGYFYVPVKLK